MAGRVASGCAPLLFIIRDATCSTGHEFIVDGGAIIGSVQPVGPADRPWAMTVQDV